MANLDLETCMNNQELFFFFKKKNHINKRMSE